MYKKNDKIWRFVVFVVKIRVFCLSLPLIVDIKPYFFMKKTILLLLMGIFCLSNALAVPAKRGLRTVVQSDGSSITVQAIGDEFHHCLLTSDGLAVARANDGKFYYTTPDGITSWQAHDVAERDADESTFVATHRDQLSSPSQGATRMQARRAAARPQRVGQLSMPTTGTPRIPVILVNFADKQMSHTKEQMTQHYTTGASSAYQYFVDQSNNLYRPQYEFYGIYTLPSSRATYGGNTGGTDKGVALMVSDAIDKAGNDIDWSQYDNDNDGYADVVIVVYAGVGEAQAYSTVPEAVWPCNWTLSAGAYYNDGNGPVVRNGKTIDRFAVFNEAYGDNDNSTTLDGIGTFCHEYSHCLGLPDFYETAAFPYGYYGMGVWSLMDYGCYNNDGYTPIGYSAYEKNFMGWLDFITPAENTQYTLQAMNQKSAATDQAIRLVSPLNSNEYFILENRQRQGWDQYLSDEGLLITHFTYMADRWQANTVNNEYIQLATIMPADNDADMDNEDADLYGKTNHEFTASSTPASLLNMLANGTLADYTGGAGELDKPVTEIVQNTDGTVSLWYVKGNSTLPALDAPVLAEATDITMSSFKASWTHSATSGVTYTLQVSQGNTIVANQTGITAKEFTVTGLTPSQTYTVRVKAVPTAATTHSESEWSNTVTVTTTENTLPKLPAPVLAEATNVTGESFDVSWTYSGQDATFTLVVKNHYGSIVLEQEGLTVNTYSVTDLIMGETYTVQVKAVPVDATTAQESEWSQAITVGTVTESSITVDQADLSFTCEEGSEARKSFQIEGQFLDENVNATITLNDPNNVFHLGKTVVSGYSIMAGSVVNVYFRPTVAGTFTATATVNYPGLDPIVINLNGTATISKQNPVMEEATQVTATSFRANWTAVPNVSSYTLYVDQQAQGAQLLLHEDLTGIEKNSNSNVGNYLDRYMSNPGWTGKYVYLEDGGLRINERTSYNGYLTSPELDFTNSGGFVTVKFNANNYQTIDKNVKLTVKTGSSSQEVALDYEAKDYTVVLPCTAAQGQKVTFQGQNATNRRLVLHDIKIYSGDATQGAKAPVEQGDSTQRVITGITSNYYVVKNLSRQGTFNYTVQATYTDGTTSDMSNTMTVTLQGSDYLRGDVNADGKVDVTDVNIVINITLGKDSADNYDGRAYLTDGDTTVDVSDVNAVINLMLGKY